MSGLNRQLIERVLGYDDEHRSTAAQRAQYWENWGLCKARTDLTLQLNGSKVVLRLHGNEPEYTVGKMLDAIFKRMKQPQ